MTAYTTIYGEIKPYVYHLLDTWTRIHYIGVRWANEVPAEQDLGIFYFTSSRRVKDKFRKNPERFLKAIREFDTKDEAVAFEEFMLRSIGRQTLLEKYYNRTINGAVIQDEISIAKTKAKLTGRKRTDEERKNISKGRTGVKNKKPRSAEYRQSVSDRLKGVPKSEEHIANLKKSIGSGEDHHFFGKKHKPSSIAKMSKSSTGKKATPETRAKLSKIALERDPMTDATRAKMSASHSNKPHPQPIVTCPACGQQGGKANMTRYHGRNGEKCQKTA